MPRRLLRLACDPRLIRFGIIGVSATLIQLGLFALIVRLADADVAAVGSFIPAMFFNHALNHWWNFRPERCSWAQSFIRYLPISLLGLALNGSIMALAVRVLGWPPMLGMACILAIVPMLTFVLSKTFAFVPMTPRAEDSRDA
jgi:dolichol-phosphate mannosyltransferase